MVITLEAGAGQEIVDEVCRVAQRFEGVEPRTHVFEGENQSVTEVHLLGLTERVPREVFAGIPGVRRVVRVSSTYRLVGRHGAAERVGFEYNGVRFGDDELLVFAGLCAVDTREHVVAMCRTLQEHGVVTTRMGAYKPRTSPYSFQGLGAECLPWVFETAGKYGIRVISMEVTSPAQLDEISAALEASGGATGVMLQIGTRNAQNFELLKEVGQQSEFPVLFKRGMGITLEESLNACEYIAASGNTRIAFCLRGVKTHLGDPHRNLVDFAHVPVVRRQTRLPVCIDPSHSVGRSDVDPEGISDVYHATGQGLIAGASMILVDFHPRPDLALCDGPQALTLPELPRFLAYAARVRETWRSLAAV
jgi:3-deoxy-7-phosphoheptulonate synthase